MPDIPRLLATGLLTAILILGCNEQTTPSPLSASPVRPLPDPPLGVKGRIDWKKLEKQQGLAVTPQKVRLGRWLFFDKRLSADRTVSCASCHRPGLAFSEPTPVSTGISGQKGTRKAPPIVNAGFPLFPVYFWDGRAKSLAEQAKGPIENPIEMGNTHTAAVDAIVAVEAYRVAFEQAYGDKKIDIDRIANAIAAYEATLFSGNSAWDRYQAGDTGAVSEQVLSGAKLFFGKAQCNQCHLGFNFTDSRFHNLGVGWDAKKGSYLDAGRFLVTKDPEDLGAFKTPSLRDVERHAPYMHDGSIATLKEVVEHYNRGGLPDAQNLSSRIRPLKLTPRQVEAVVAFMKALDGDNRYEDAEPPELP